MTTYFPVDNRAELTLAAMLSQFTTQVITCLNMRQLARVIVSFLPPGISYGVELQVRMERHTFSAQKEVALHAAENVVMQHVLPNLPSLLADDGQYYHYYTREDLLAWLENNAYSGILTSPPAEEAYALLENGDRLPVPVQEIPGLAYGLYAASKLALPAVTVFSSLLAGSLSISDIANRSPAYSSVVRSVSGEYSRPYHISLRWPDDHFYELRFSSLHFLRGILRAGSLLALPNQGAGVVWRDLSRFTRSGPEACTVEELLGTESA